jgi:hypothetical protein
MPMLEDIPNQRLERTELGEDDRYMLADASVIAYHLVVDDCMGHGMPFRVSVSNDLAKPVSLAISKHLS